MDWNRFVGLWPEELDPSGALGPCWPLVRAVYRAGLGVDLPAHDTVPAGDGPAIEAAARAEIAANPWRPVDLGRERAFDVMLCEDEGGAGHVGVVLEPGRLLHAMRGHASCQTRYDRRTGRPFRIAGIYRWDARRPG
ncbi:MAG: hypothetical protein ACJ71Y_20870 [Blastococcus sp.]|jgi:cell wall-associated NlpC family hydrolase